MASLSHILGGAMSSFSARSLQKREKLVYRQIGLIEDRSQSTPAEVVVAMGDRDAALGHRVE
jgi:hypothetical protein